MSHQREPPPTRQKPARRKVPGTGLASNRNHPERMLFRRRLLIPAVIPALVAGVFALPAATASAAPPPGCAVLPSLCHPHRGPLPKGLANAANLNPQPL